MDIEREKALLLEKLKLINDPKLLQAIRNLIAGVAQNDYDNVLQGGSGITRPGSGGYSGRNQTKPYFNKSVNKNTLTK